jgi:hypothetical protein
VCNMNIRAPFLACALLVLAACRLVTPAPSHALAGTWRVHLISESQDGGLPPRFEGKVVIGQPQRGAEVAGTYSFALDLLQPLDSALMVRLGVAPDRLRRVEGSLRGDSVFLSVNPDVDHGNLLLRGAWAGLRITGQWTMTMYAGRPHGSFVMSREP